MQNSNDQFLSHARLILGSKINNISDVLIYLEEKSTISVPPPKPDEENERIIVKLKKKVKNYKSLLQQKEDEMMEIKNEVNVLNKRISGCQNQFDEEMISHQQEREALENELQQQKEIFQQKFNQLNGEVSKLHKENRIIQEKYRDAIEQSSMQHSIVERGTSVIPNGSSSNTNAAPCTLR